MERRVFETPDIAAEALAALIADKIGKSENLFNLAVSGGSTPARLFSVLAEKYGKKLDWEKVRFFWVDERCVPPDHKESNFRMTKQKLLNRIPVIPENIFRMRGEEDPEREAERYGKILTEILPWLNGKPVFDLILLGMGDDGHTASIFPDQMDLLQSEKICVTAIHPQSGQKRISLSGPVICNGRSIVFFITGKAKKSVLTKILNGDLSYPAGHIRSRDGKKLLYYLDREAAPD